MNLAERRRSHYIRVHVSRCATVRVRRSGDRQRPHRHGRQRNIQAHLSAAQTSLRGTHVEAVYKPLIYLAVWRSAREAMVCSRNHKSPAPPPFTFMKAGPAFPRPEEFAHPSPGPERPTVHTALPRGERYDRPRRREPACLGTAQRHPMSWRNSRQRPVTNDAPGWRRRSNGRRCHWLQDWNRTRSSSDAIVWVRPRDPPNRAAVVTRTLSREWRG